MADERDHLDGRTIVRMRETRKRTNDADLAREFLPDLADKGDFCGFARFNLAAGKFPFQGLMLVLGPLREQY